MYTFVPYQMYICSSLILIIITLYSKLGVEHKIKFIQLEVYNHCYYGSSHFKTNQHRSTLFIVFW